jgi:hypothetical protein
MTVRTQLILPRWSPRPEQTEGEADETYGEREREAEARLLAVRPEQVRLEPQQGLTVVEVPTLNDAYARASMRLEPLPTYLGHTAALPQILEPDRSVGRVVRTDQRDYLIAAWRCEVFRAGGSIGADERSGRGGCGSRTGGAGGRASGC